MEAYSEFAYLYDTFMEDVPYDKWADLLSSLIKAYGENVNSIIDLGCGTGSLTMRLYDLGYTVMGIDYSADMLSVASDKSYEAGKDILYINQDMRELSLSEKVDAVVSICDCINYLLLDEDVIKTFKRVSKCLNKGGLFIFDFNTIYKYETVIGDTTIAENREDCAFIWENFYSSEDHLNEYDVTFFSKIDTPSSYDNETFRRFTETHIQRGYTLEEMKHFIEKAGLKFVTALDETTRKEPTGTSERIYIVARK